MTNQPFISIKNQARKIKRTVGGISSYHFKTVSLMYEIIWTVCDSLSKQKIMQIQLPS